MRSLPVIGSLLAFFKSPTDFLLRAAQTHGDVVDLGLPLRHVYLINRPDLIEKVLVTDNRLYRKDSGTRGLRELLGDGLLTSDGDHWLRQRRLAQPGFHRERIASYGEVMVASTERMLEGFRDGDERDIHEDMMRLTREIVAKTLFDADLKIAAETLDSAFEEVVRRFADCPPGVPIIHHLPTRSRARYLRARQTLDDTIYGIINERRASGRDPGDLLSMLMNARDEADGSRMSDRQIRDEAMTLFLAGHETTALALSWTFLLLSQHPEAERRLHEELDRELGDRPPTAADLPRLRYTEHILQESMRLYPPAWAIGREALEETQIGGYRVPKGAELWMSQWVTHRDRRYFDAPEAFRPERWEGDFAKRLPRYAYFPFGGGPRLCIGVSFAMMESTLLLAAIAKRFRVLVRTDKPIKTVAVVTFRPARGLPATIRARA